MPKTETRLWVSFHKNGKAFISGWGTIIHAAREVGTKAERWRQYLRGSMCRLANGLKLNGAFLMETECLRSAECWEPQSCAIQMYRGRVQSLWLNNAAGDSLQKPLDTGASNRSFWASHYEALAIIPMSLVKEGETLWWQEGYQTIQGHGCDEDALPDRILVRLLWTLFSTKSSCWALSLAALVKNYAKSSPHPWYLIILNIWSSFSSTTFVSTFLASL